ncbi:MAG: hypothetical protein HY696_05765 [Deltaproteobacteria bacterium]|nr:hypothetical protein [Deltaproteobacteria bacterium]
MKRWLTCLVLMGLSAAACNSNAPSGQVAPNPAAEEGTQVVPVGGTQLPVPIELPAATPDGPAPTKNLAIRFPDQLAISVEEMTKLGGGEAKTAVATASLGKSLQTPAPSPLLSPPSVLPGARPGFLVDGPSEMVSAVNGLLERYLAVVSGVRVELQYLAADAAIPTIERATPEGGKVKVDFVPLDAASEVGLGTFSGNAMELSCGTGCARTLGEFEAGTPLCYRVWVQPAGGAAAWRRFMMGKFLRLPGATDQGAGCFRAVSAAVLVPIAEGVVVTEAALFATEDLASGWRYDQSDPTDRRLEAFMTGDLGASADMQAADATLRGLHVALRETGPSMDVAAVQLNAQMLTQTGPAATEAMQLGVQVRGRWRRDGDLLRTSVAMQRTHGDVTQVLGSLEDICLAISTGYQTIGCPAAWQVTEPVVALPVPTDTALPTF